MKPWSTRVSFGGIGGLTPTFGCLVVWGGFVALYWHDRTVPLDISHDLQASPKAESLLPAETSQGERLTENSVGMMLAYVPAGSFQMGSNVVEDYRERDERRHRVRISRPFLMGVHEVTVAQFRQFVEETGYCTDSERSAKGALGVCPLDRAGTYGREFSWRNPGFPLVPEYPAMCVSWNDAQAYCRWLSQREQKRYRLPTEAEWEYACRAGSREPFSVPHAANWPEANLNAGSRRFVGDQERPDDGYLLAAPVGSYSPNAWGLHDMHGNAREWCSDWYEPQYPRFGGSTDPTGPATGTARVTRGAGYLDTGPRARSANRSYQPPTYSVFDQGFRVVCEISPP